MGELSGVPVGEKDLSPAGVEMMLGVNEHPNSEGGFVLFKLIVLEERYPWMCRSFKTRANPMLDEYVRVPKCLG